MADIEMAAPKPTGNQSSRAPNKYDILDDPKGKTASDMRNSMLVVAALISAATFTAGMNPPGGVFQEHKDSKNVGKSILATNNSECYAAFYFLNAAAFSSANLVIFYLVYLLPYCPEIYGAMLCMSGIYGLSTGAVSHKDLDRKLIWCALFVPYAIRITVEVLKS